MLPPETAPLFCQKRAILRVRVAAALAYQPRTIAQSSSLIALCS